MIRLHHLLPLATILVFASHASVLPSTTEQGSSRFGVSGKDHLVESGTKIISVNGRRTNHAVQQSIVSSTEAVEKASVHEELRVAQLPSIIRPPGGGWNYGGGGSCRSCNGSDTDGGR